VAPGERPAPSAEGIGLVVGLGNAGDEYEGTRHNAGFWFVDRLARRAGATFRHERKFSAWVARARLGDAEAWLAKPTTFMNLSGQAVGALASFYRIGSARILVAHDELDIEPGDARLKLGGGTAGHNGLKSIRDHLSSADFWRLRLGIGHPRTRGLVQDVADYVLHAPRREEEEAIRGAIDRAEAVLPLLLEGRFERARVQLGAQPAAASAAASASASASPSAPAPKKAGGERP